MKESAVFQQCSDLLDGIDDGTDAHLVIDGSHKVFLVLAVIAFVVAGPAILAIHKTTLDTAIEESRMVRIRFLAAYQAYAGKGILLGLVLALAMILFGMPVYFALWHAGL